MNALVSSAAIAAAMPTACNAMQSHRDHAILDIEKQLQAAWNAAENAADELSTAARIVRTWQAANRRPTHEDFFPKGSREFPFAVLQSTAKEFEAAATVHGDALRLISMQCGYEAAKLRKASADEEVSRIAADMVDLRATTIEGLAAKARVSHTDEEVEFSIVRDLLALDRH